MSFVSLNTALSGIRAARTGMDTAAHNVANANTDGYTRQRVELKTSYPYLSPNGPMGTGVTVENITRVRDSFLDARLRGDTARSGELDVKADLLARAETVFGEPESGLTGELTELWASFEDLSLRPDDRAARRQVLSALESITARVKSVAGGLETMRQDTTTSLSQAVDEVNGLFDQMADLNRSIADASAGSGTPNDLMDARDRVIDQLSRRIGAQVSYEDNGTVRVSVAGLAVVSGTESRHLSVDPDTAAIVHQGAGVEVRPGGEVAGLQGFLQEDLPALTDRLHAFVTGLKDELNTQHAAGWTAEDPQQNGVELFAYDPGAVLTPDSLATGLELLVTDPDQLAAASAEGEPYNGENAAALAGLRTESGLGEQLRSLITEHAAKVAATDRAAEGQRQLTAASSNAREGMHGVSLDEEMVSMLSYQHALEASSRVMTAVDEALNTIINRTGLVGR
jgi:flagellar hook-associated protein 1 FlgK